MAKAIKSIDDLPVFPFDAIKRALVQRGHIPRKPKSTRDGKKNRTKHPDELVDLKDQSHEVLFKAETVFPFTLFPDTVILDRTGLTIVHRTFFRVAKITNMRVEDLLTSDVNVGPFFGSVNVATRFFINQDVEARDARMHAPAITFLWKHDALELHKLLQGYIVATQKEIDCSDVPKDELIKLLHSLGENEETVPGRA